MFGASQLSELKREKDLSEQQKKKLEQVKVAGITANRNHA